MKKRIQSYCILILSLGALFASGLMIGRQTAQVTRGTVPTATKNPADIETWMAAATRGLVTDLQLEGNQQRQLQSQLEPVATALFTDQERALFQMHLRLLEFHDTFAATGALDERQKARLAASRAKLKDLIIRKFPVLVRGNPVLAIGGDHR